MTDRECIPEYVPDTGTLIHGDIALECALQSSMRFIVP